MPPRLASALRSKFCPVPAAVAILWHVLAILTAFSQQGQTLPDVRLRSPANVAVCLKLQDGTTVLGGTIASVDGVETGGGLIRLDARGAVMPDWIPDIKSVVERIGEDGGFVYVAGKNNGTFGGTYGAVRRIRIADGQMDPAFSIVTLGPTDQLFFGGGWLFITGNWEDSNIQAWWLGASPAPENPVFARDSTFINSVEWAGTHQGRLLVLSGGTLWSLPLPAVKGDSGHSILKERNVRSAALDDSGILWILTDRGIRGVRPDQSEPDQLIPLPPDIRDNASGIAAWKGRLWIYTRPSLAYGIEPAMTPVLQCRDVEGPWRDVGSAEFKGRPGALRGVQVDDQEVRVFGRFPLDSGAASFARLRPDGAPLERRRILGDGAGIRDVAFLPEGGAVVAGDFEEVDGLPQRGFFRLKPDWTCDRGWRADCDGPVAALQVDHDRILAGGFFPGFLAAFPLNGQGRKDPSFPPWGRGAVFALNMSGGSLYALSWREARHPVLSAASWPFAPPQAVATRSVDTGGGRRELWAVEKSWYPSWREGLAVVSDRVLIRGWPIMRASDGRSEDVHLSGSGAVLDHERAPLLFGSGGYSQRGRSSLGQWNDIRLDPLWMFPDVYPPREDFTPLAAVGNWVYGRGRDRMERRSIYGRGERDDAVSIIRNVELIRVRGPELLASQSPYTPTANGWRAVGRYLLPEKSPQPVISGYSLPAQATVGEAIPLTAVTDTGDPVTYASSGAAAFGNGKMVMLEPGSFVVRAYQNGPGHEPAAEQDRTLVAGSGRRLRFTMGDYLRIPSFGTAESWPSVLPVRGISGKVTGLSVMVEGLSHRSPHDLQIVLENPSGKRLLLFDLHGGKEDASRTRLVFHDAGEELTDDPLPASGLYRPVGGAPSKTMPAPLTTGPWAASLAELREGSANGDWRLYVYDEDEDEHLYALIGSWTLLMEPEAVTFDSWAAQYSAASAAGLAMEADADPDGDGIPNLAEYAFGTPPIDPTPGTIPFPGEGQPPVPVLTGFPGNPVRSLQFIRRRNSGVICQAEFSADLEKWTPAETETVVVVVVNEDWERVTASAPSSFPTPKAFARVRVTAP